MADRILGPAYPALLAPFLPVIGRPRPGMEEQRGVVVGEPDAVTGMVLVFWPSTGTGWDVTALEPADLAIDYNDPHTRDRVLRAMPTRGHTDEATLRRVAVVMAEAGAYPFEVDMRDDRPDLLRALAAAVWGPR